jgi:hypothetical protein
VAGTLVGDARSWSPSVQSAAARYNGLAPAAKLVVTDIGVGAYEDFSMPPDIRQL